MTYYDQYLLYKNKYSNIFKMDESVTQLLMMVGGLLLFFIIEFSPFFKEVSTY